MADAARVSTPVVASAMDWQAIALLDPQASRRTTLIHMDGHFCPATPEPTAEESRELGRVHSAWGQ
jgi:hypothetical protein